MANTFELIESYTVASAQADYTFTTISSSFTDLCLKISARSTANGGQNCNLTFNSTASGYSDKIVSGSGSGTPASFSSGNTTRGGSIVIPGADFTSNTFGNGEIYIPNYTGSTAKSFSNDSVTENNTTLSYAQLQATLWTGTAAITSIKIDLSGGNFAVGSTFYLYGVKNA